MIWVKGGTCDSNTWIHEFSPFRHFTLTLSVPTFLRQCESRARAAKAARFACVGWWLTNDPRNPELPGIGAGAFWWKNLEKMKRGAEQHRSSLSLKKRATLIQARSKLHPIDTFPSPQATTSPLHPVFSQWRSVLCLVYGHYVSG